MFPYTLHPISVHFCTSFRVLGHARVQVEFALELPNLAVMVIS